MKQGLGSHAIKHVYLILPITTLAYIIINPMNGIFGFQSMSISFEVNYSLCTHKSCQNHILTDTSAFLFQKNQPQILLTNPTVKVMSLSSLLPLCLCSLGLVHTNTHVFSVLSFSRHRDVVFIIEHQSFLKTLSEVDKFEGLVWIVKMEAFKTNDVSLVM